MNNGRVLLAAPRGSCAGVDRAVSAVEKALELYGSPVYVRKQIVHNSYVVAALVQRGAIFVEETDEVPDGGTLVFSAHGVAPAVRSHAQQRGLRTIDTTCPLVTKIHREATRFADAGYEIIPTRTAERSRTASGSPARLSPQWPRLSGRTRSACESRRVARSTTLPSPTPTCYTPRCCVTSRRLRSPICTSASWVTGTSAGGCAINGRAR